MPNHEGFAYPHARLIPDFDQTAATFERERNGFFAKNMATATGSTFSMFAVKRIRSGNVNGIDFFAVDRGFQIIVGVSVHAVAPIQLPVFVRVPCNQRHQL